LIVTVKKPLIEQADDKIIYNTESDPMAASESAIDILRKTPFVTVDGDGNIQVNGQSNFKVLLNGRETSMFARNVKDALKAFPGSLIKKIEIITSPSAKYDAEGVSGLINIITQKKVAGYNGNLSVAAANTGFANFNGSINLKYGKFGASGYIGYGGNKCVYLPVRLQVANL
jgi:outer membrane receptor for ferrienterochelin and colicin